MSKTTEDVNLDEYVLQALRGASDPIRMRGLIYRVTELVQEADPELFKTRRTRLGEPGWSMGRQCEASAQRLKAAGKVELVRGKGSGWRLAPNAAVGSSTPGSQPRRS